ncbi:AVAST type 2 anti-phage system protein Avs2 [Labilibaculum euxinus]
MKKIDKIKSLIDWILSWMLKLRLKKTYWSVAAPLIAFFILEIAKFTEPLVALFEKLSQTEENQILKFVWTILSVYFDYSIPIWGLILLVVIFGIISYLFYLEKKNPKLRSDQLSELIQNNIENILLIVLSKFGFQPNKEWFSQKCEASILDLGKRYTPELNVKVEISEIFEGLGRTEEFKNKVTKLFDQLLIKGKKVLKQQPEIKESIESLGNHFDELYALFHNTKFLGISALPIEQFESLLSSAQSTVREIYNYYITEERRLQKEKNEYHYYQKYGYDLRNIREFEYELSTFQNLIHNSAFQLANNPFLLLDGEAGVGKSHLIGDIVSKRIMNDYESLFILGQHFVTEEDPWTQMFKRLQINSNAEEFLNKLNQRAIKSEKRIVLFIDAINEGKGNYFWNSSVRSFINEIKKYEGLGLVLTIRTSYKNLIFPQEEKTDLGIVEHHHYGFKNIEYEASKLFFDNYKIELPNVPLLHPEFQNPLFLRLFCEGINKAGLTRIPSGLQGITSIINFFVKNVNNVLSKPNRFGYSNSLNLVEKSIYALIKYRVDNQLRYVPYELAYQVIDESISTFVDKKGFIDELIVEGVLSKNLFWEKGNNHEHGVYLAYERFEDHLTVQYLLEQYPDLEKELKEGGQLHSYVKDKHAIYMHKGLIEAFSIQVPEKNGHEFSALIPDLIDKRPIIESFIESLLWRKVETINQESKNYVNEYVFSYRSTYDLFWETILSVAGIPDHLFNARSLHNNLMRLSLPERDTNWTPFLKYRYSDDSSVKRLIDWAWNQTDKSHISDESIMLSSITLAWFHTSTNRKLRDCSTKALVCLLQNRLGVLLEIMKMFEKVNDPYVYERLFAVAYGCVLRTHQKEKLAELSEYIFKIIFNNPQGVLPHILLRDYARGTIEYVNYLGIKLSFDLSKIRPPYKSTWPVKIPSIDELKDKYDNDQYYHLWSSIMGFGDFSRYTIGTNHRSEWSNIRIGATIIDRNQVYEEFKTKLTQEQLEFLNGMETDFSKINSKSLFSVVFSDDLDELNDDVIIDLTDGVSERTIAQRNKFKGLLTEILIEEYEKNIEPYIDSYNNITNEFEYFDLEIAQRMIFSKVVQLGWTPKLHLKFDNEIGSGRGRDTTPHERIGKKYQWIAYYEYMALLGDNFIKQKEWGDNKAKLYEGPWDPYVRDIDPTMLISNTGRYDDEYPQEFWWVNNEIFDWDCTNEDWIKNSSVLPSYEKIIQVKDQKEEEWLVLEGYPSWSEPKKIGEEKWDQPHKELWSHIRSYIVKDAEFYSLKKWAVKQDFTGRWMPESGDRYEMFSREYYWSHAQQYFNTEYYGGIEWADLKDKKSDDFIAKINVTAQGFLWEEEFDKSKEETISFLKPSAVIYKGMNLKYGQKEGELLDRFDELQCFAANVYHDSKSYLLVKKEPFLKFLKDNNLKIVWTVLGEKQIIGGRPFGKNYPGRLEINGAYYFDKEELKGKVNLKNT